jgi:hypothetical protein
VRRDVQAARRARDWFRRRFHNALVEWIVETTPRQRIGQVV